MTINCLEKKEYMCCVVWYTGSSKEVKKIFGTGYQMQILYISATAKRIE